MAIRTDAHAIFAHELFFERCAGAKAETFLRQFIQWGMFLGRCCRSNAAAGNQIIAGVAHQVEECIIGLVQFPGNDSHDAREVDTLDPSAFQPQLFVPFIALGKLTDYFSGKTLSVPSSSRSATVIAFATILLPSFFACQLSTPT